MTGDSGLETGSRGPGHHATRTAACVRGVALLVTVAATMALHVGCSSGAPAPATVDTRNDQCAHCRMGVSDLRFASQLVAPQEDPKFFDDLGCLRDYLKSASLAPGTVAYVSDYRTRSWVPASRARLVLQPAVETPMGSHIMAFADEASLAAEPAAAGGTPIGLEEVFGPKGPPGGAQ